MNELARGLRHGRLLAVGAHPDDLALGTAGALLRAVAAHTVVVTDGAPRHEPNYRLRAVRRRREELAAMERLGIPAARITWLGHPDQQVHHRLERLIRQLRRLLRRLRPTVLLVHAFEGGHPDHDATAFALHRAAQAEGFDGALYSYPLYHRQRGEVVLSRFRTPRHEDRRLRLGYRQRRHKRHALSAYRSQRTTLAPFPLSPETYRREHPDEQAWLNSQESVYGPLPSIEVKEQAVTNAFHRILHAATTTDNAPHT
ncbi:PIG-L deacetylase family protein [Endothiovibrio diazotrophicus]